MLPKEFEKQMLNLLGEKEFNRYLDEFNKPAHKGVVVNAMLLEGGLLNEETKATNLADKFKEEQSNAQNAIDVNDTNNEDKNVKDLLARKGIIMPFLGERLSYTKSGFKVNMGEKLGNTWFHHSGLIYLQEPSSMAPVATLAGEHIKAVRALDLCASPGGKSIDLKLLIGENGLLVSNEIVPNRSKILFSNIERMGLSNCVVTNNSPKELAECFNEFFDVILVDAPCSGEGMFRKDNATTQEWSESVVKANAKRQLEILACANKMLKPNGFLVYSTCTFNTTENEGVATEFANLFGYEICDVPNELKLVTEKGVPVGKHEANLCRRFYPMGGVGEGQFMCLLKKKTETNAGDFDNICLENNEKCNFNANYASIGHKNGNKNAKVFVKNKNLPQKLTKSELELVKSFLSETVDSKTCTKILQGLVKIGNNLMYCCEEIFVGLPLNFLSQGACVGEIVKNRVEPHHQFFKVFGNNFKARVELDAKQTQDYLFGLEVKTDCAKKGFGVVTHKGIVLGGVKIVNGTLKNYYPKGLRAKVENIVD